MLNYFKCQSYPKKASNCEMVLYSYSIGFVYILIGEMVTGTFTPAFTYFNEHPKVWL